MKALPLLTVFLFLLSIASSQDLSGFTLHANYSFSADGSEASSTYADATLTNATFSDGGVASNGNYIGSNPSGTFISTPVISGLMTSGFAIQLSFKPEANSRPILMCGDSWRWMELGITDSDRLTCRVSMTNNFDFEVSVAAVVTIDQWQTITVVYDEHVPKVDVYLGSVLAGTANLDAPLKFESDYTFSNQDGGLGVSFKGLWKDLKIYNANIVGINDLVEDKSINVHPVPAANFLYIYGDHINGSSYEIINAVGEMTMHGQLNSSNEALPVHNIPNGSYFLNISNDTYRTTKKITLLK